MPDRVNDKSADGPDLSRGAFVIPDQGDGGFDVCWYPIALSDEIKAGEVRRVEFLDGHVVAFRGQNGQVSVVSPAYLSSGRAASFG